MAKQKTNSKRHNIEPEETLSNLKPRRTYPMELKLEVYNKYKKEECGYKKLARMYGLNRDLVRSWVLSPRIKRISEDSETSKTIPKQI